MAEMNRERSLVALLKEICDRRQIQLTSFSSDWIFCLQKDDRITYVFGYDFGINSASAKLICKDKTATSDLLGFHGVPRIEHRIFHGAQLTGYVPQEGNWSEMLAYLEAHPGGVVCKPNEGTGGNAVYLARTPAQLELAVYQVFNKSRSLCLSPFEEFESEYRVALLEDEIQFIYRKVRPQMHGDGRQTIRELFLSRLAEAPKFAEQIPSLKSLPEMNLDWDRIPAAGESVKINWRHNLGQGSKPDMLSPEEPTWKAAAELARRAAKMLGVKLASVDIADTSDGLKVLEINSGIMMETFVKSHPHGPAIAARFYDRIVCLSLGLGDAL